MVDPLKAHDIDRVGPEWNDTPVAKVAELSTLGVFAVLAAATLWLWALDLLLPSRKEPKP